MLLRLIVLFASLRINHPPKSQNFLLGCIGEGRYFNPADFALIELCIFNLIWINIGLFCRRCVFNIDRHLDTLVIVSFIAVFSYFTVSFRIEILWFYCRNVPHVPWNMRIDRIWLVLLGFQTLIGRNVSHIANNRFFGFALHPQKSTLSYIFTLNKIDMINNSFYHFANK